MKKPYYITTAIAYTSKKPHIGNSYEIVLTDALARFKRMQGFDVFFLTGTDEHGQKIEECANDCNCSPEDYVDKIANEIREICDLLNTTYDKFIRTTDDYHVKAVQNIFKRLYEQGDIYKSEYEGMYCVPCEGFYTSSQLIDGKCPECGSEVRPTKEEAYFLKLSKYQKRLEEHIEKNPDFIYPESRKREMLNNFIKPGLQDLCVSRTSFKWGVPVTFDDKHIIYVWVDALSNYITALGFDAKENSKLYYKYWPADVHIIGKDILRFHTIYWPIILMALGEPLPKQIFGHPWLLMGNDKMSKSKGNVIYADDLVNLFGVDAVRHYLLSEMPHASDGSLTYSSIIERYNSELANTLGNLVNRCVAMVNKYFDGVLWAPTKSEPIDSEIKDLALSALPKIVKLMDTYHISDAVDEIFSLARRSNKYIDETTPWLLAKDEDKKERLATVLYNLIESIRFIAVLLSPFMPDTSGKILSQIGCDINSFDSLSEFGAISAGQKMGEPVPLFSRLDEEEVLAKIESALGEKQEENEEDIEGITMIGIEDFSKVDLRVAEIVDCKPIKRAKKLLELTLNDGTTTPRTVVSGIARWYSPENLVGKKVVLVYNLSPATLCGIVSNGMILAANCGEDDVRVIFVDDMPLGAKIS
ncbi:MAG TPA: methionine--tRNA ligase [Clostridia bacterium]|nr:methionine--tRNA ligase [Clostridia bacterium]